MNSPVNPSFTIQERGVSGPALYGLVSMMIYNLKEKTENLIFEGLESYIPH